MSLGNNELSALDQFAQLHPPLRSHARRDIQPGKTIPEQVICGPAKVQVWLFQRRSIHKHLFIDQPHTVPRHANHALHEMLRGAYRIMKHHDVTAPHLTVRHHIVSQAAATVSELIDQQVIAHQQRILHGRRRNLERLHDERDHKHRDHHGSQQRLQRTNHVRACGSCCPVIVWEIHSLYLSSLLIRRP